MPPITNLSYTKFTVNDEGDGGTFSKFSGEFDVSQIDKEILFQSTYTSTDKSGYTLYEPQKYSDDDLNELGLLGISVSVSGDDTGNISVSNYSKMASFDSPGFSVSNAYFRESSSGVKPSVNLTTGSNNPYDWFFMTLWSFGKIKNAGTNESPTFSVRPTSYYNYSDIPINQVP